MCRCFRVYHEHSLCHASIATVHAALLVPGALMSPVDVHALQHNTWQHRLWATEEKKGGLAIKKCYSINGSTDCEVTEGHCISPNLLYGQVPDGSSIATFVRQLLPASTGCTSQSFFPFWAMGLAYGGGV